MIDFCCNWKCWWACGSGSDSPELNISTEESRIRPCSEIQFCIAPAVQPLQLTGTMVRDILLSGPAQGHRTEPPAPTPHTLHVPRLPYLPGAHKSQPRASVPCCQSLLPAQHGLPVLCSAGTQQFIKTRADPEVPGYVRICQNLSSVSMVQIPYPNCHIPEQTDFQVLCITPPPGQLAFLLMQRSPKMHRKLQSGCLLLNAQPCI